MWVAALARVEMVPVLKAMVRQVSRQAVEREMAVESPLEGRDLMVLGLGMAVQVRLVPQAAAVALRTSQHSHLKIDERKHFIYIPCEVGSDIS